MRPAFCVAVIAALTTFVGAIPNAAPGDANGLAARAKPSKKPSPSPHYKRAVPSPVPSKKHRPSKVPSPSKRANRYGKPSVSPKPSGYYRKRDGKPSSRPSPKPSGYYGKRVGKPSVSPRPHPSPKPSGYYRKRGGKPSVSPKPKPSNKPSGVPKKRYGGKPSVSPKPSGYYRKRVTPTESYYTGAPSGFPGPSPVPSGYYIKKRVGGPSPSPKPPTPSGKWAKRDMLEQFELGDVSDMLCPPELWACPMTKNEGSSLDALLSHGFECVNFNEDLESCGGCGVTDVAHDCTAIPAAKGVSCVYGQCQVQTCEDGYVVSPFGNSCVRA